MPTRTRPAMSTPLYSLLGPRRFRLLSLGESQDLLRGDLQEHSLNEPPLYEALSYVWQQPLLRGKDDHLPFQITRRPDFETFSAQHKNSYHTIYLEERSYPLTENLAFALWCFRYNAKPRLLWIDQVCINQHDIDEKTQQVCLMGNIYKSAKTVLVWLGEEIDGVGALFEAIHSIPLPTIKPMDGLLSPQPNKEELLQFEAKVKLFESTFYDRLRIICERPWFRRALGSSGGCFKRQGYRFLWTSRVAALHIVPVPLPPVPIYI